MQVYFISRGRVKPANKNFAAVRNDYTINLDNGCALVEGPRISSVLKPTD